MDPLAEIPVRIPRTSPSAAALLRAGAKVAQDVAQALKDRFKVGESALSIWPVEQTQEDLVFQARVPRAVLSASGGVNSLADLVSVMLEEAALRHGRKTA